MYTLYYIKNFAIKVNIYIYNMLGFDLRLLDRSAADVSANLVRRAADAATVHRDAPQRVGPMEGHCHLHLPPGLCLSTRYRDR